MDNGKDHVFYDYDNSIISDYEDCDLEKVPFSNSHFIMMVYMSEERMRTPARKKTTDYVIARVLVCYSCFAL